MEVETAAMGEVSSGFVAVGLGSLGGSEHLEAGSLEAPEVRVLGEMSAEGWVAPWGSPRRLVRLYSRDRAPIWGQSNEWYQ